MKNYNLVKKVPKEKYYEVYINADSNDADYISTTTKYSQEEFDEVVDGLVKLRDSCDYELEDFEDETGKINIPSSYGGYCHTLEEVTVTMFDVDGLVYDVEF